MTARACPVCHAESPAPNWWPFGVVSALVVCAACGSILVDSRASLREPDETEFRELDAAPWGHRLRSLQRQVIEAIGKPRCPWCGLMPLDWHTADEDGMPADENPDPQEGDSWVCGRCYNVAVFNAAGLLERPDPERMQQILAEPQTQQAIAYLRKRGGQD